jgi:rubrerythrin
MTNLVGKVLEKNSGPFDVMSMIFSNFAQVSEKQKKPNMERLFSLLAESCRIQAKKTIQEGKEPADTRARLEKMQRLLQDELGGSYGAGLETAGKIGDRGVLRALTWGKKVNAIEAAVLKRFQKAGKEILKENEHFQVCQACGFIMTKDSPPDICPVCKAPASRFETI